MAAWLAPSGSGRCLPQATFVSSGEYKMPWMESCVKYSIQGWLATALHPIEPASAGCLGDVETRPARNASGLTAVHDVRYQAVAAITALVIGARIDCRTCRRALRP
jgi:hypothetical protein